MFQRKLVRIRVDVSSANRFGRPIMSLTYDAIEAQWRHCICFLEERVLGRWCSLGCVVQLWSEDHPILQQEELPNDKKLVRWNIG